MAGEGSGVGARVVCASPMSCCFFWPTSSVKKKNTEAGWGDAKEADLYASEQKGSPRQPLASGRLRRGARSLEVSQGWGDRCMWLERCSVRAEVG